MSTLSSTVLAGNLVRLSVEFRDDAQVLTDPTTVTIRVGLDATPGTSLSVVKDSVGVYHADWDTTDLEAGDYWVVAEGTGALIAARQIKLKLRPQRLT
jgi:hypothetical protein